MVRKKSHFAWALELSWQALFYSIPAMVDLGQVAENLTVNYFGGDYKKMIVVTIIIALNAGWILPNIFYMILYLCPMPFFEKYRCQDWVWDQPQSPRRTKYMEVLKSTIVTFVINQAIMSVTIYYLCHWAMGHTDDAEHLREFVKNAPSAFECFVKHIVALLIFETCFYWTHVWLHTPMGYRFHKDHHAYYTPMSLAGQWGSVMDGLVSLPIPAFVPVFFLGFHPTTLWSYALVQTMHSSYDHCGYDFPFNPFQLIPFGSHADAHNFHHSSALHNNYGLYWRFWDDIMGTNQDWEKYREKRDALFDKLESGTAADADDEDYVIRNGVMLLKTVAEQRDIDAGIDNLEFTFKHLNMNVDEHGNIISTSEKKQQ